jgi:DNA-binding beta-propeller fold protein YncE
VITTSLWRPSRRTALAVVAICAVVTVLAGVLAVRLAVGILGAEAGPVADPAARWALQEPPIAVGADPGDVEAGEGYVWVSGVGDGTLTRIDPATGDTTRIPVGGEPGQIVVADGAVWVRNLGDRITRVDTETLVVSPPVAGGGAISGMTVGGGYVWLAHRGENTVSRVDARTSEPVGRPIGVGSEPRAMEFGNSAAYVVNDGDGTVSRIDAASGTVTAVARVGESVSGIEVDGGRVYLAADDGVVAVAEDAFTAPGRRVDLPGFGHFVVRRGVLFVVYSENPRIERVDANTGLPIGEAVTGVGAEVGRARFAFDRLWMTNQKGATVQVLAPA